MRTVEQKIEILRGLTSILNLPRTLTMVTTKSIGSLFLRFFPDEGNYEGWLFLDQNPVNNGGLAYLIFSIELTNPIFIGWGSMEIGPNSYTAQLVQDKELFQLKKQLIIPKNFSRDLVTSLGEGDDLIILDENNEYTLAEPLPKLEEMVLDILAQLSTKTNVKLPRNNDGRDTCAFCGAPTKQVTGFSIQTVMNVCTKCGR